MMSANRFFVRLSTAAFLLAMMSVFGVRLRAQDVPAVHVGDATITGIPDDWTHHHVFFSDPGTEQDAVKNGTHEEWLKTVNDPRYVIQQLKRGLPAQGPAAQDVEMRQRINAQLNGTPYQDSQSRGAQTGVTPERWGSPRGGGGGPRSFGPGATAEVSKTPLMRDWSMNVGGAPSTLTLTVATPTGNPSPNVSGSSILTLNDGTAVGFQASPPTAATTMGTFTANPTVNNQALTIGSGGGTETFRASLSTQATQTGTFSSLPTPTTNSTITVKTGTNTLTLTTNATESSIVGTAGGAGVPAYGDTISIVNGSNTLTLTDTTTASASAMGTVLGEPQSGNVPTIQITNVTTGVGLTLVTNATGATATGTFLATGPSAPNTLTIGTGPLGAPTNTLTLTAGNGGTGTITVTGNPACYHLVFNLGCDTLTVSGVAYTFTGYSNCTTTANCIFTTGVTTNTQMAENIAAAITANPALCSNYPSACYGTGTTAVPNIGAVSSTGTDGVSGLITVSNYTGAAETWTYAAAFGNTDLTLSPTGSIAAGTTNSCTSATTGTFVVNPTSVVASAAEVNTAINACFTAFPAVGVTSAVTGSGVITVTDTAVGTYSTLTLGGTAGNFYWTLLNGGLGNAGTNSCYSSTIAYFAAGTSAATATSDVANNIYKAFELCGAATGITMAHTPDTSQFTVTNPLPGASLQVGVPYPTLSVPNVFSWTSPTGSNGSSGCTSSTTGGFLAGTTAATVASSISAAITACNTSYPAVGLTSAYTNGNTYFTLTTPYLGTGITSATASMAGGAGVFSWGALTPGSNGSQTCTSSTTATYPTAANTTLLAASLASAIQNCNSLIGVTATSATNVVTLTSNTYGTGGNGGTLTPTTGTYFKWANGALANGGPGQQGFHNANWYFNIDFVSLNDNATNLVSAITAYNTANGGGLVTPTSSGATVTLTDKTLGTGGNALAVGSGVTGFTWAGATLSGAIDGVTSGTASPPTFAYWSGNNYVPKATLATNLATAINANPTIGPLITATASSSGGVEKLLLTANIDGAHGYSAAVTAFGAVTGAGTFANGVAGGATAGQSPAKYSYWASAPVTAANCTTDFIVYPTGAVGSATQATIVAYNNMYHTTCATGSVPAIYFAYNTGGTATLSPIFSFDGKQVAYIQTTGGVASLVLLKMANSGGTIAAPKTPTLVTAANYRACAAGTTGCYTTLSLGAADTNSAPWWDYSNDLIYVGDSSGKLHQFSGVFNGATPVEVTAAPWPVPVASGALATLTSPVLDSNTGNIYIGEGYTTAGPSLMQVNIATGAVTASGAGPGGSGLGTAYLDAPMIDEGAGMVYAFIGDDGASTPSSAVYQIPESNFTGTPVEAKLGPGTTTSLEYDGTFDNAYYTSASGTAPTGNLYVCGYAAGSPALYQIPITADVMGTAAEGAVLTSGAASCSPISEVYNGTQDLIFLSVSADGGLTAPGVGCKGTGTAGACVYSFNVAGGSASTPLAGLPASGGTGTIIIDNTSSAAGASQIYFSTLSSETCGGNGTTGTGTGACAVQASQAALQ